MNTLDSSQEAFIKNVFPLMKAAKLSNEVNLPVVVRVTATTNMSKKTFSGSDKENYEYETVFTFTTGYDLFMCAYNELKKSVDADKLTVQSAINYCKFICKKKDYFKLSDLVSSKNLMTITRGGRNVQQSSQVAGKGEVCLNIYSRGKSFINSMNTSLTFASAMGISQNSNNNSSGHNINMKISNANCQQTTAHKAREAAIENVFKMTNNSNTSIPANMQITSQINALNDIRNNSKVVIKSDYGIYDKDIVDPCVYNTDQQNQNVKNIEDIKFMQKVINGIEPNNLSCPTDINSNTSAYVIENNTNNGNSLTNNSVCTGLKTENIKYKIGTTVDMTKNDNLNYYTNNNVTNNLNNNNIINQDNIKKEHETNKFYTKGEIYQIADNNLKNVGAATMNDYISSSYVTNKIINEQNNKEPNKMYDQIVYNQSTQIIKNDESQNSTVKNVSQTENISNYCTECIANSMTISMPHGQGQNTAINYTTGAYIHKPVENKKINFLSSNLSLNNAGYDVANNMESELNQNIQRQYQNICSINRNVIAQSIQQTDIPLYDSTVAPIQYNHFSNIESKISTVSVGNLNYEQNNYNSNSNKSCQIFPSNSNPNQSENIVSNCVYPSPQYDKKIQQIQYKNTNICESSTPNNLSNHYYGNSICINNSIQPYGSSTQLSSSLINSNPQNSIVCNPQSLHNTNQIMQCGNSLTNGSTQVYQRNKTSQPPMQTHLGNIFKPIKSSNSISTGNSITTDENAIMNSTYDENNQISSDYYLNSVNSIGNSSTMYQTHNQPGSYTVSAGGLPTSLDSIMRMSSNSPANISLMVPSAQQICANSKQNKNSITQGQPQRYYPYQQNKIPNDVISNTLTQNSSHLIPYSSYGVNLRSNTYTTPHNCSLQNNGSTLNRSNVALYINKNEASSSASSNNDSIKNKGVLKISEEKNLNVNLQINIDTSDAYNKPIITKDNEDSLNISNEISYSDDNNLNIMPLPEIQPKSSQSEKSPSSKNSYVSSISSNEKRNIIVQQKIGKKIENKENEIIQKNTKTILVGKESILKSKGANNQKKH